MKVMSLLGSARPKSNTAAILSWVEEGLTGLGHEVERVRLQGKKIGGCLGCALCREKESGPTCVQKDDGLDLIIRMSESDAVIWASPLYFWGFSAQMKALIDRTYCCVKGYHTPEHTSFVDNQIQALVVTAAGPYEDNGEEIITAYRRTAEWSKVRNAGELFVGELTTPEDIPEAFKDDALKLAQQIHALS